MRERILRLLAIVGAIAAVACADPAGPVRDPRCWYQGDTIGVLVARNNGVTCHWIIATSKQCFDAPVELPPLVCPSVNVTVRGAR